MFFATLGVNVNFLLQYPLKIRGRKINNMRLFISMENREENSEVISQANIVELRKEEFYPIWDKCSSVLNANLRCRMVANLVVALAGKKLLSQLGIETEDFASMQNISSVLSRWDISELYVNGCKISVRYAFGDYKYFVAKKQDRYGLLGDLFMFIRLSDDWSTATLEGFLPNKNLNKANSDNENYYFHTSEFKSFEDIQKIFDIRKRQENIEDLKKERIKIVQYLEGDLSDKVEFFKLLGASEYLRKEMIKFENSEKIFSQIVVKEDVIKQEIEKDITNISKLADAFIQSRETIIAASDSETFKLECARANLEKLFSSSKEPDIESIKNKSTEEVMDTLLANSPTMITDNRLPVSAVLKAFRFFGILILMCMISATIYCFVNYTKYVNTTSLVKVKSTFSQMIELFK